MKEEPRRPPRCRPQKAPPPDRPLDTVNPASRLGSAAEASRLAPRALGPPQTSRRHRHRPTPRASETKVANQHALPGRRAGVRKEPLIHPTRLNRPTFEENRHGSPPPAADPFCSPPPPSHTYTGPLATLRHSFRLSLLLPTPFLSYYLHRPLPPRNLSAPSSTTLRCSLSS